MRLRPIDVSYNGSWLSTNGVADFQLQGNQIVDSVLLFRATAAKHFPLGNRSASLSFTVPYSYSTRKSVEEQCLAIFASLPNSGDIILKAKSSTGYTYYYMPGSVLESVTPLEPSGLTAAIRFTFSGPPPSTSSS